MSYIFTYPVQRAGGWSHDMEIKMQSIQPLNPEGSHVVCDLILPTADDTPKIYLFLNDQYLRMHIS